MAIVNGVTIDTLPDAIRSIAKQQVEAVVKVIQEEAQNNGLRLIQQQIDKTNPPPVDTGKYRKKWFVAKTKMGVKFLNLTPYSQVIELGRRVGAAMPPVDKIQAWALRKGIVPTRGSKNAKKAARDVAWMIAKSIQKKGIKAKHVLSLSLEAFKPELEAAITKALGKINKV